MKKCLVLKANVTPEEGKRLARELKKAHEKLWGKGTCSVVVLPYESDVVTVCEDLFGYNETGCQEDCCNDKSE